MDNCLFIGGGYDGKWDVIPFDQQYYDICITPDHAPLIGNEMSGVSEVEFRTERYRKDVIKTKSNDYHVMALMDMSNDDWIRMLFEGYRQTKI